MSKRQRQVDLNVFILAVFILLHFAAAFDRIQTHIVTRRLKPAFPTFVPSFTTSSSQVRRWREYPALYQGFGGFAEAFIGGTVGVLSVSFLVEFLKVKGKEKEMVCGPLRECFL